VFQEAFLADCAAILEVDAGEELTSEGTEEGVTAPFGEGIAVVDGQAGGGDGGEPVVDGLFQPLALRGIMDHGAAIVDAVADDGPAIVEAGTDQVDLVAALGSMLAFPEVAGAGVEGETLEAAVAVGPDLGLCTGLVDEGVVVGDAAVVVKPDDGASVAREVLRRMTLPGP